MQDIQAIVDSIYDSMVPRLGEGKVADYIPELAKVDPNQFGIAITTVDGTTYTAWQCAHAVFDPEHFQGLHADAGAR